MGAVGVSTSGSLLLSIMGHWIAFLSTVSIAYFSSEANAVFTPLKNNYDFACVAENLKASETYYCDSQGHVRCLPGWSDEASLCTVPVCDVAVNGVNETCVHGMCAKPFTCECDIGWFGQRCEKCVTLPGCLYGTCENALECKCHPGYEGMLCDKPSCPGCVHGDCLMPNMCTCNPGWTGANCTECMTRPDCQFGRCVNQPFECLCDCGFEGVNCEKPRCKDGCHPQNGFCDLPDECRCKPGWTGANCQIGVSALRAAAEAPNFASEAVITLLQLATGRTAHTTEVCAPRFKIAMWGWLVLRRTMKTTTMETLELLSNQGLAMQMSPPTLRSTQQQILTSFSMFVRLTRRTLKESFERSSCIPQ